MGKNIAAQQVLEHPLCQVTNERYFTRMDILPPDFLNGNLDDASYAEVIHQTIERLEALPSAAKVTPIPQKVCHNEYARLNAKKNYTPEKGRAKNLRQNYGMTLADYDLMLFQQGGVCAICKQPEMVMGRNGNIQQLGVDHNHKTGDVRQLLCNKCNVLVRFIEDDRSRVKEAIVPEKA